MLVEDWIAFLYLVSEESRTVDGISFYILSEVEPIFIFSRVTHCRYTSCHATLCRLSALSVLSTELYLWISNRYSD